MGKMALAMAMANVRGNKSAPKKKIMLAHLQTSHSSDAQQLLQFSVYSPMLL